MLGSVLGTRSPIDAFYQIPQEQDWTLGRAIPTSVSARRGLIHRVEQALGMAVVVGIERPHEGTAQPKRPIGIPDPDINIQL